MIGSLNNAWRDAPTIVIMAWCCGVLIKYLGWVLGGSCIGQASVASAVRFTCGVRTAVPIFLSPMAGIRQCDCDDREWGAIPESELSGHLGKPESTWLVVHSGDEFIAMDRKPIGQITRQLDKVTWPDIRKEAREKRRRPRVKP